jgi:hypothetical protein
VLDKQSRTTSDNVRACQDTSAFDRQTEARAAEVTGEEATRFWLHSDNRISLHPPTTRYRARSTFVPAWIDYATTEQVGMESAAKRKAASAAMGDGDGRPAKRQKMPVRAAPRVVECLVGGGSGRREECRAMRDGS